MSIQAADTVFMVRPVAFGYNEETALTNAFQQNPAIESNQEIQSAALAEFDRMTGQLNEAGIQTIVLDDTPQPPTPDSIFPNNWISFHLDGTVVLYPMQAMSRRQERRKDIIDKLIDHNFQVKQVLDLTFFEEQGKFLEGTGSIVFDYDQQKAFANLSPRTDSTVLELLTNKLFFKPVVFEALDKNGKQIYHTNVVMCIADRYAVICLESVPESERESVHRELGESGKEVISISYQQLYSFAGNMLQLSGKGPEKLLVISQTAYNALNESQRQKLASYNQLLPVKIDTIEKYGGGSVRCMLAAVHLPRK